MNSAIARCQALPLEHFVVFYFISSSQQPYEVSCIIISILQIKGLWLREGK